MLPLTPTERLSHLCSCSTEASPPIASSPKRHQFARVSVSTRPMDRAPQGTTSTSTSTSTSATSSQEPTAPPPSASSTAASSLKRRPSYTRRPQKTALRLTIRRIISASHQQHLTSVEPLLSIPTQLGAVTEAVLQDHLPFATHSSAARRDCIHALQSRSRYRPASIHDSCPSSASRNLSSARHPNTPSSSSTRCHSFDIVREHTPSQGHDLCSSSSTAELQSSVPLYPFSSQDHPKLPRAKVHVPGKLPQAAISTSVPPTSRSWASFRLSLTASPSRRVKGRRRSESEALWTRIVQPRGGILSRLRSGSTADISPLSRRTTISAWPPVTAMVHQGLTAAKRTADLDQQYRESVISCSNGPYEGSIRTEEEPKAPSRASTVQVSTPRLASASASPSSPITAPTLLDVVPSKTHSVDTFQLPPGATVKPLPPLSKRFSLFAEGESPSKNCVRVVLPQKGCIGALVPGNDRHHKAVSIMACLNNEKQVSLQDSKKDSKQDSWQYHCLSKATMDHSITNDVHGCADHQVHCYPLTIRSDVQAMAAIEDDTLPLSPISTLDDAPFQDNSPLSISSFTATATAVVTKAASSRRLESFRFPLRKSPIEKNTLARPHRHRHCHHKSLPYNTMHSRHLDKVLDVHSLSPFDIIHHTSSSNASLPESECKKITGTKQTPSAQNVSELDQSGTIISRRHGLGSERHKRSETQRLRRSESCSYISHRPSLSFNSSKRVLLSLQDRRICKPDAKVHCRLPDILTTPAVASMHCPEPVNRQFRSQLVGAASPTMLDSSIMETQLHLESKIARSSPDIMGHQMYELDQGHHTLEIGIGSSTPHSVRGTDVTGVQAFDHDLRGAMNENDVADGCEGNNIVLCAEPQDEKESAPLPSGTAHSTFKSSLASTLEEFAIDPKPVIEAGKIKRFVKRSHALQELETTEESYVNDLDILLNVYLHILETRSWFPRSIHSKMQRCVSGLLALHRDFHSRLRACKVGDSEQERQELLTGYKNLAESFELLHHDNHIYSLFCELRMRSIKEINQSASQATIAWLRKDSKELMAQQGRPSIRADLKDFLIKPIQRICRYPLLLKEIMRLTSEDDSEYPYLDHAYQLMKNMAREMDEAQKAVERKLLTELFLKKLPETNFPRKTGIHSNKDHSTFGGSGENSSNTMNCSNTCGHSCNCNSRNSNGSIHVGIHSHHPHGAFRRLRTSTVAPLHSPGFAANSFLDFGFIQDGVAPIALTKAFAGTLGSIVLAGALEYVISPDVPIRLKYYGCFLFDTMLVVVKAKKSSLYEPRQWLPLRLCELHETSCLDGYTRFGWRIVFDQFRLDFGASTEAEQQTWISTLQDRIQASKDAHAKLPRDIVAFETIVSSLPWKMNKNQTPGLVSSRHLQICQQSPSPSPSPWSACSSAIPSPLMPPPPSASSSTMMMAMSSAVVVEPEKWNAGELRQTIDDCTCHEDGRLRLHHHEAPDCHTEPQCLNNPSTGDREGPCIGGMAGTEPQEKDHSEHLHSQTLRPYDRQLRPESAANLLYQSMQIPWLLTENRQRTHSFDVTRVFTSSNNSIKHNQRVLIQSMFKDVSTEDVWTTTTASQPSPQPVSALSRYGSSSPFSYFHSVTMPPSPRQGVSGILHPTVHSESIGSTTLAGEDSTGTFPVSLTNRLLRRPDSLTKVRVSTIRSEGIQEKTGKDRRRNSTTAAIAGTLSFNFRKNSDPQLSANQRLRSSTKETLRAGSAEELECTERSHHDRQTSVSAMVNRIENRTSAFLSHEIKHSQSNTELWSVDMPYLVEDDYGDKDILDTLTTAGEAARSRRGGERMTRRYSEIATVYDLKSSSSSYSLPATFFRSANTSTQSLTPSRPKDGPKDGAEKIWSAMGRMMQKRSHERSGISRSRSSSSSSSGQSQAGLASHPGNVPLVLSPMSSPMRRPLQLNHQDSVIQEDSMGHKETMCRPATVFERTLLRRSSTAGSRSTTTSSSTFSNHIRTNSASTIQSLGSESSFTGSSATEMSSSSGAPRVIMAAPSVSITGCSSEPSPEDDRTLVSVSSGTEPGSGHVVNQHLKEHQKEMQASPKIVTHALAHPRSHLERNGSSSSSHDRRKSFSILHNITYSASQKFKTLMRSPSSARRRTVMSLSPITKEQTFDSNDEGHDESQEGEEQEGDCGAKAAAT